MPVVGGISRLHHRPFDLLLQMGLKSKPYNVNRCSSHANQYTNMQCIHHQLVIKTLPAAQNHCHYHCQKHTIYLKQCAFKTVLIFDSDFVLLEVSLIAWIRKTDRVVFTKVSFYIQADTLVKIVVQPGDVQNFTTHLLKPKQNSYMQCTVQGTT